MKKLLKIIRFIHNHPLARHNRYTAYVRFIKLQIATRIHRNPIIFPFVENSKLIIKQGMTGATGNIYVGLHEFEDMAFLLHLLRPGDLFGDIGANVGAYTILASVIVKAKSVSLEPIPSTYKSLVSNIRINKAGNIVATYNNGVGATKGSLKFTKSFDTVNHVIAQKDYSGEDSIEVPVVTLDHLFLEHLPTLLKIDVEGFELNVLKGGENVLKSETLKAIIIELNGSGNRYGIEDKEVHNLLLSYNFLPHKYEPFTRKLLPMPVYSESGNTIYIRDKEFAERRVCGSRKYFAAGKSF
jgi:FkbM family methyltransferase